MIKQNSQKKLEGNKKMNEKQKKISLNGTMLRMCIGLFFGIILAFSVFAGQVPTALDTATKCGTYNYVLNNSDVLGDQGAHIAPALGDLDADGDLDMIIGNSDGYFRYFRNDNGTWVNVNNDMFGDQGSHARPDLVDFDKDGDLDLIFVRGDSQVSYYENVGTKFVFDFKLQRDFFGTPWGYSGTSAADMDDDGDYDLAVTSSNSAYTYYYENVANEYDVNYELNSEQFLGYTNSYSECNFLDYDYDGDYDAICVQNNGQVFLHRNIGNSTLPKWDKRGNQETYLFDFSDNADLKFVDWDGDGDYDMFVGNDDGTTDYYEGTYSETGKYLDFELNQSNFLGDSGTRSSPAIYDIDNDGDLDIYVAEDDNNRIGFYENDGGSVSFIGTIEGLDGLGNYPRIQFVDADGDGVMDIISTNDDGNLRFYKNVGTISTPLWSYERTIVDIGSRGGCDFKDIDGDGDYDAICGENSDLASIYYNVGNSTYMNLSLKVNNVWTSSNMQNWYGGILRPKLKDLNEDGNLDLILGRDDGYIEYFENENNNTNPDFKFINYWFDVGNRAAPDMVDTDNDGDLDLYSGKNGRINYFENVGSELSIDWQLTDTNVLDGDYGDYSNFDIFDSDNDTDYDMIVGYSNGYIYYFNNNGNRTNPKLNKTSFWGDFGDRVNPAVADIDDDGDLDLLLGRSNDNQLKFYESQVVENLSINWTTPEYSMLGDQGSRIRPVLIDWDNDGDLDIILGNSAGEVKYFRNDGTPENYNFVYNGTWIDVGDYASPTFADVNNDGKIDMVCGENDAHMHLYNNTGTVENPVWVEIDSDMFNGCNYGGCSYTRGIPLLVDFDNDGDYDIFSGGTYTDRDRRTYIAYYENTGNASDPIWTYDHLYYDSGYTDYNGDAWTVFDFVDFDGDGTLDKIRGGRNGLLRFYKNEGILTPNYKQILSSFASDSSLEYWLPDIGDGSAPAWGDLDNDGDYDIIVGMDNGSIRFIKNTGPFNSAKDKVLHPAFILRQSNWYAAGQSDLMPHLEDYDGDGDYDMLLGYQSENYKERRSYIDYVENQGSKNNAVWVYKRRFYDSGRTDYNAYSRSSFGYEDLNGDGVKDLLIGGRENTRFFKNEGTNLEPNFVRVYGYLQDTWGEHWMYDPGYYIKLNLFDWDGDGDFDVISGISNGSVMFYRNDGPFTDKENLSVYPSFISRGEVGPSVTANTPFFYDWDKDGDYDMIVGYQSDTSNYNYKRCYIDYYRNEGSALEPIWNYAGRWQDIGRWDYNSYSYPTPVIGDFNNDGKDDLLYGTIYGRNVLLVNDGTIESPSWRTVIMSENDEKYFVRQMDSYPSYDPQDLDNDGDLDLFSCSSGGDCYIFENKGLYTNEKDLANNAAFINRGYALGTYNGGSYVNPKFADFDGDGDYDVINSRENGCVYFWENIGNSQQYRPRDLGCVVDSGNYADAGFGDMDNDGDLDMYVGNQDGYLKYYENQGTGYNDSCIVITNSTNYAVSGVNVKFYNDTNDLVCNTTTDTYGKSKCNLSLTEEGTIRVSGAPDEGYIQMGLTTENSKGKTSKLMKSKSSNYNINLKHFEVSTAGPKGDVSDGIHLRLHDRGGAAFMGHTDSNGYIDGFLPEKYLVNRQEPYSQNRIKYDLDVHPSEFYGSHLRLTDLYMPNSLTLGSTNEANKLFKFPTAKFEVTDAKYKHYLIYPAVNAQKDFKFVDNINNTFTFVNPIKVRIGSDENLKNCTFNATGDSYSLNKTTSDCSMLGDDINTPGDGDWVVVEYTLKSPGLASFLANGWTSKNFTFPTASLGLKS